MKTRIRRFGAGDVEIGEDWKMMKAAALVALANTLASPPVKTRNEAFDVVEAELAARARRRVA